MILDYNPAMKNFVLRFPRGEADAEQIMLEHGFDLWAGSPPHEAIMWTQEPYAALSFYKYGTPAVQAMLAKMHAEVERSWAEDCNKSFDIPLELWPFQRASIDYALSRKHTLIADEPGLGKTPIAITIANEMKAQRVLVVCPASIRYQWVRRIKEWSTLGRSYDAPNNMVYAITSSAGGVHESAAWTVISWDLVRSPGIHRALAKGHYDLLILDEAHYAKHGDRGRTRAIFGGGRNPVAEPLAERSERVVALTGTPLPNRPREAYTLARHLCWDCIDFASEDVFNERFNPVRTIKSRYGRVIGQDEKIGREYELQNRLRANMMVRHLKRDVMKQLHYPAYDLVYIEENSAIKAALEAERLLDIDPENLEGADAQILGQISEVRRVMGIAMAPGIAAYVRELLEGGEGKVTVFAWHTDVVDILYRELTGRSRASDNRLDEFGEHRVNEFGEQIERENFGCVTVTGADNAKAKDVKVQRFINDRECRVVIGNVLSLGTGTDGLQHVCTRAVLAEPDWVHGNNQQCIDRLDRGGQRGQVLADVCVVAGSISERVLAASLRKAQVVEKALDRRVA